MSDLTDRNAVPRAIREYDELERGAFLAKNGLGRAQRYKIRHEGELYDLKEILAAAHGVDKEIVVKALDLDQEPAQVDQVAPLVLKQTEDQPHVQSAPPALAGTA